MIKHFPHIRARMILLLALGLQPVVMVPEVMLENRPRVFYIQQKWFVLTHQALKYMKTTRNYALFLIDQITM